MSFDPYDEWLKIAPGVAPPSHYALLGLAPFEPDPRRIHDAGMERIANIRRFQLGPHGAEAIKLLGELALAFDCLTTPERKTAYDEQLRASLEAAAQPAPPEEGTQIDDDDVPSASVSRDVLPVVYVTQTGSAISASPAVAISAPPAASPRSHGLPNWAWVGAGAFIGLVVVGLSVAVVVALSDSGTPAQKPGPVETAHFAALPAQDIFERQPLVVPLSVVDPAAQVGAAADGGSWRFFVRAGAPKGARIDAGAFVWTPDESQGPGSYRIALGAKKPGRTELVGEFKIQVREANQAPQITAIADATVDEERPYSFTVLAKDADLPPNRLTFSLEPGAPEGMHLDPDNGRLTWTPSESQGPGEYLVGVRVSDDFSPPGTDIKRFSITVREVNRPPVFEPIDDFQVELYDLATVPLKATDPDLPKNKLTFSFVGAPPPGAQFDDSSGTFVWRPAPESYGTKQRITLRVTDDGAEPLGDRARLTIDVGRTAANSIGMPMVYIQPGEFRMGWEHPPDANQPAARDVSIAKPFYLGKFEVTADEFALFVKEQHDFLTEAERDHRGGQSFDGSVFQYNPSSSWRDPLFPQTGEQPVVNVTWNDAKQFCNWLTKREGRLYRLPTEAEWEYCCRAGTDTIYSSGDDADSLAEVANLADASYFAMFKQQFPSAFKFGIEPDKSPPWDDGFEFTAPVGSLQPNAFGLYDLHGNAAEWCEDAFGGGRIVRGGSFRSPPVEVGSALRQWHAPKFRRDDLGFRVVADGPHPVAPAP